MDTKWLTFGLVLIALGTALQLVALALMVAAR